MTTVSMARPTRCSAAGSSIVPVNPAALMAANVPAKQTLPAVSGREIELSARGLQPVPVGGVIGRSGVSGLTGTDGAVSRRSARRVLSVEGLLAAQGELNLPMVPQRIWLVGPEGPGLQSFMSVLDRSPWRWSVIFVPTAIDGADAPWAYADAVSAAPHEAQAIVLLGPGQPGTSGPAAIYESEPVGRAICSAKAPVISALGRHDDRYLAEECAWAAVMTPREAADLLCRRTARTFNQVQLRYHNIVHVADRRTAQPVTQPEPEIERPPPAALAASVDAIGLHRISRAEAAARRAQLFMLLLAALSALLIAVVLAVALR